MKERIIKTGSLIIALLPVIVSLFGCNSEPLNDDESKSEKEYVSYEQIGNVTWPAICVSNVIVSEKDEKVNVIISIANNPGIAGALLGFEYDNRLTLIESRPGKAFSALEYTPPGRYENPCRFFWDSENCSTKEDGEVLTLTFKLPENTKKGDCFEVKCFFTDEDVYNQSLDAVSLDIRNGKIDIE